MPCSIASPANTAVNALLVNEDLDLPTIDLNGFTIPDFVALPTNLPAVDQIDLGQLTDGKVGGAGMFDQLMVAVDAHLANQFQKNRITGDAYARSYTELIQSTMTSGVQFLLSKDQAYWGSIAAQQSAYMANAQLARATIEAKTAVAQLAMVMAQMKNERAAFALTKAKVATEEAAYCTAQFNLTDMLPKQSLLVTAQTANVTQESANLVKQGSLIEKQALQVTAQTGQTTQETTNLVTQGQLLSKQVLQVTADTSKTSQETSNLLVQSQLLSKQVLQVEAQTANTSQETQNLVKQGLLIVQQTQQALEQTEQVRAQTSNTRLDNFTPVGGIMGVQKLLYQQQVDSYKRDQEHKYLKILTDAWVTQKTMDEGLTAPTSFTNSSIDAVMAKYRANTALI